MQQHLDFDQLDQLLHRLMCKESWIIGKFYYDLISCVMYPEWEDRNELRVGYEFMIDFVKHAESLRIMWTPERILEELISLNLRDSQMERFTSSLWRNAVLSGREHALVNLVNSRIEQRITTGVKIWWKAKFPRCIETRIELCLWSYGIWLGYAREGPRTSVISFVDHEKEFFGMETHLGLHPFDCVRRDAGTMRLAGQLNIRACRPNVEGLTCTPQTELASVIAFDTKATRELSLAMAAMLLSSLVRNGPYGNLDNIRHFLVDRVHRRRTYAILNNHAVPGWTPEQYLELCLLKLGHSL